MFTVRDWTRRRPSASRRTYRPATRAGRDEIKPHDVAANTGAAAYGGRCLVRAILFVNGLARSCMFYQRCLPSRAAAASAASARGELCRLRYRAITNARCDVNAIDTQRCEEWCGAVASSILCRCERGALISAWRS